VFSSLREISKYFLTTPRTHKLRGIIAGYPFFLFIAGRKEKIKVQAARSSRDYAAGADIRTDASVCSLCLSLSFFSLSFSFSFLNRKIDRLTLERTDHARCAFLQRSRSSHSHTRARTFGSTEIVIGFLNECAHVRNPAKTYLTDRDALDPCGCSRMRAELTACVLARRYGRRSHVHKCNKKPRTATR